MTHVAAVGGAVLDGVGWRDEIEGMITGFPRYGVFADLGHVAFNASAADAHWRVMSVIRKRLVFQPS